MRKFWSEKISRVESKLGCKLVSCSINFIEIIYYIHIVRGRKTIKCPALLAEIFDIFSTYIHFVIIINLTAFIYISMIELEIDGKKFVFCNIYFITFGLIKFSIENIQLLKLSRRKSPHCHTLTIFV